MNPLRSFEVAPRKYPRYGRIPALTSKPILTGEIGNGNEVLAGGTLDLPARELHVVLEELLAMGAVEFEFNSVHGCH